MNNRYWNRPTRLSAAFAIILLSSLTSNLRAADEPASSAAAAQPIDVEIFHAPRLLDRSDKAFRYPEGERQDGYEGWVHLNFMVDPQGKAVEPMVVESSNPVFDREALRGVQSLQFEPAKRGTTAIYASQDLKVIFSLRGLEKGARPDFVDQYKRTVKAIDANDRDAAAASLAKMKVTNLYEDAYLSLCRYDYHLKWGTEAEQLRDLRHALAFEKEPNYLTRAQFIAVLTATLRLELKRQDFGPALDTWTRLEPMLSKKDTDIWKPFIDEVAALRTSDAAFSTPGEIAGAATSWNGVLLKRRFRIQVASGRVSEIKLRCERNYLFFPYDPQLEYKVEARSGRCSIELVGDPGTKFDLVQS
jgi:TonB family protein